MIDKDGQYKDGNNEINAQKLNRLIKLPSKKARNFSDQKLKLNESDLFQMTSQLNDFQNNNQYEFN